MVKACIFDLDGVLVDTAKYHFLSWKKIAKYLGFSIKDNLEEKLKGVSRIDSLEIVLEAGGYICPDDEKKKLARLKNEWYLENIKDMGESELLPGVVDFLHQLKNANIKMAVGSASKNAWTIIDKVGIKPFFEIIVDGNMVEKTKPDPEVFLKAAQGINSDPQFSIVFEDSYKGIEAANTGGFISVGVGIPENLPHANLNITGFEKLQFNNLKLQLEQITTNT